MPLREVTLLIITPYSRQHCQKRSVCRVKRSNGARRAVLARLEPRLHRDGWRGADEQRVVEVGQLREVRQRNDRFRESS